MARLYILSGFSLSMLPVPCAVEMIVHEVDAEKARKVIDCARRDGKEIVSAVGHESTAKILSELLGFEVPVNRIMVKLEEGDEAVIFQLFTRLPEGRVLNRDELEELVKKGLAKLLYLGIPTLVK